MMTLVLAVWGAALAQAGPGTAPDAAALYAGDRFALTSVEEIAPGIHVMRRDPSWRLPVLANTTLIVNEHDAVLIDGGFPSHAENIVAEVRRITDKPVSAIVTTHWHGDHNMGHFVFRDAWPDAQIIAHEATRHEMVSGRMDYVPRTAGTPVDELAAPALRTLEELEASGGAPELIAYFRDAAAGMEAVRADYARWQFVPADETFAERLVLHRGERRIEILFSGPANTEGDAYVWLPQERIVITGDIVVRPTPYGFGSFTASWAGVLREINALDYAILVPGHGDIQYDESYADRLARTLDHVFEQACAAIAAGAADGPAVEAAIDWEAVESGFTGDDPVLARLFEVWFKRPISVSAFNEIEAGAPCEVRESEAGPLQ
ncbi:MBL fold metallo-hydrolase [Marinicauda algicola]|uniref:MBL fold metallo-hydrolase n=1 Tax=Marinicauda algicola TaxID=2029849 RepID=A0A4S2H1I0_9PROT|nr:MBL fold metallo-hydrolase [Marinicauda algicola]TGY89283.1 MBL fold metallo-hydrolase [Marinicauda algicola]